MKKKRKTRSEKYQSHMRSAPSLKTSDASSTTTHRHETVHAVSSSHYSFVPSDLQKTALITSAIVIAELVLFFVMKP